MREKSGEIKKWDFGAYDNGYVNISIFQVASWAISGIGKGPKNICLFRKIFYIINVT